MVLVCYNDSEMCSAERIHVVVVAQCRGIGSERIGVSCIPVHLVDLLLRGAGWLWRIVATVVAPTVVRAQVSVVRLYDVVSHVQCCGAQRNGIGLRF